jgi:multimeric flavodoxin WrbA
MTKRQNYEVELRYAGPKAKTIRAAMKLFLDRATSAYIESHVESDDAKRRVFVQEALEYGMAIDSLIREHAMHVVWGGELEDVKRIAANAKSPKVKKALEKLAEQLSNAKPTSKKQATTGDDDGRFE